VGEHWAKRLHRAAVSRASKLGEERAGRTCGEWSPRAEKRLSAAHRRPATGCRSVLDRVLDAFSRRTRHCRGTLPTIVACDALPAMKWRGW
jgi:hypothetical protein